MRIQNLMKGQVLKNYRELCQVLEVEEKAGNSKKAQLCELERYVSYHKEGYKFIINEIYELPKEKRYRSDRGLTRDRYSTIKEQFKPLIFSLVISQPDYTYTGSFNNWMEYSRITTRAWGQMNRQYNEGNIKDKNLNEFFRVEGGSLNYMFNETLKSMKEEDAIEFNTVRIAIIDNRDIIEEFGDVEGRISPTSYKILNKKESEEIDSIEKELLEKKYGVEKLAYLVYGNKSKDIPRDLIKLKKFKREFNNIIQEKYAYDMCFRATKVSVKKEERIQEFKKKYGITEDMQNVITTCKDKIYESRLRKAESRHKKKIVKIENKINEKYNKQLLDNWGDDDFVELLRHLELSGVPPLKSYMKQWVRHYRQYIHNKI